MKNVCATAKEWAFYRFGALAVPDPGKINCGQMLQEPNGVAPLAMPRRWRTVLKKQQAEKIP
jgi:hypothetical protein